MAKVTVYLKNAVIDEIKGLVEEDIQAGAQRYSSWRSPRRG